jgi:hypothetical protein
MVTVNGDDSLVHTPNVNKKNAEMVVPFESNIKIDDQSTVVTLSANSVNIIVLNKI